MATSEHLLHELIILDETGDTKLVWDADRQAEIDEAKATFERMKKKGYVAYKVDRKGDKGEVIEHFDPTAEKMIMAPQMKGG